MMPRRKKIPTVTVEAWPDMIAGHLYPAVIKDCTLDKAPSRLRVTTENRGISQRGRRHEMLLSLPVRPGSRACRLFVACGIDANQVGTQITIDRIIGCAIGLRYSGRTDDGTEEFDFEKIVPPPTTKTATAAPGNAEAKPSEREDTSFPANVHGTPL
jgi:hypothetical protein